MAERRGNCTRAACPSSHVPASTSPSGHVPAMTSPSGHVSAMTSPSDHVSKESAFRMDELIEAPLDEAVLDDADEKLYSEFVERRDGQNVEEMSLVPFEVTDEEQMGENVDMGTGADEDEDRSIVPFDMENPTMTEGNTFPSIIDCRNALSTFSIKNKRSYVVDKSDRNRLRVHCPNRRCKWRMHASAMRNSTVI